MTLSRPKFSRDGFLLLSFALIFLITECLQGYIFKGDSSKAFTNAYSLALIILMLLLRRSKTRIKREIAIGVVFIVVFFLITFLKAIAAGEYSYDVFALMRSLVLSIATFTYVVKIRDDTKLWLLKNVPLATWLFISVAIFFARVFDFGLYTYEDYAAGRKFFFPSVNELTFVYISAWALILILNKSWIYRVIVSLSTLAIFYLIGNKSYIALVLVVLFAYWFLGLKKWGRISILFLIPCALLLLAWMGVLSSFFENGMELLVSIYSKYSTGAEKFNSKLSYLDTYSTLISERDMLWALAWQLFQSYDLFDVFLGKNLAEYGLLYGRLRGQNFSFSENDVLDVFMSYGVMGIILFLGLMTYVYNRHANGSQANFERTKKTLVILFVVNGFATGHLFLFGVTCFYFSLYAALLSARKG